MNKFYEEHENQIIILHANILKLKDLIKCIKDVVSKKNNRFWLIDSIKSVREFLNYLAFINFTFLVCLKNMIS